MAARRGKRSGSPACAKDEAKLKHLANQVLINRSLSVGKKDISFLLHASFQLGVAPFFSKVGLCIK